MATLEQWKDAASKAIDHLEWVVVLVQTMAVAHGQKMHKRRCRCALCEARRFVNRSRAATKREETA
jgi:hypothetical protein